jgi:carboxylesterase
VSPLLAGHGADVDALAATTRAHWLESANAALSEIAAAGEPVTVIGGSAGALLAICVAAARPHDVAKLALLAAPLSLGTITALQIRLLLRLPAAWRPRRLRVIRKRRGVNVIDRTLATALRSLPAYPLEALGELLDLIAEAEACARRVTQPVLIAHGALDSAVPATQADRLAAALRNARRVERVVLPRSAHLVGIDHDREVLAARLLEFVQAP